MSTTQTETTPRVWIGCLACYNSGHLVGDWINATLADTVTVDALHTSHEVPTHPLDVHEGLWVMDHEGFGELLKGECSPCEAQRLAELLDTVPEHQRDALAAFVAAGNDAEDFDDAYAGEWDSLEEYAEDYLSSTGMLDEVPEWAQSLLDVSRFARDLQLGGEVWTDAAPVSGLYVFRCV